MVHKTGNREGRRMRRLLLLLLVLAVGVFGAEYVFANTHQTTLKPGETYNCSKAKANTSVYINKPGKYTLTGKSRYVRVVITCADVKCYLDNVNLNAGAETQVGQWASPLNVVDDGGTVTLISKKGSYNYFEGYNMPGIRKQGTNTELVFETEKPNDPGTIEVQAGACGAAAIGSTQELQFGKKKCGNFTFNSGKVIARSYNDGAAIGGGSCVDGKYIRIHGGEVEAYGWGNGAGIGGGGYGSGSNIEITGGKVYAEAGASQSNHGAAAIGGGGGHTDGESKRCGGYNMHFTGGEVKAIGYRWGAAIGGGKNQGADCIYFEGAKVYAKNKGEGPAIGSGTAGFGQKVDRVYFLSGEVTAIGGGEYPAIGAKSGSHVGKNSVHVEIWGGHLTARGGSDWDWDIGGGDEDTCTTIKGGTVVAKKIEGKAVITGGSVYTDEISAGAENGDEKGLHRVDVQFEGLEEGVSLSKLTILGGDYSYGMKDVVTMEDGYFYPWFPFGEDYSYQHYLRTAYAKGHSTGYTYYGKIPFNASGGVMSKAVNILLSTANYDEGKKGSAYVIPLEKQLMDIEKPEIPAKTVALGYYTNAGSSGEMVADMEGNLQEAVRNYTNHGGEWISDELFPELYCKTRQFLYNIHFDPNPPKNASTKGKVTGSMDNLIECKYRERVTLPANGFTLPGYGFAGWNTKADGKGDSYVDQDDTVRNLSDKDGGTATLYAQWVPKKYDLTLDPGDIGGNPVTVEGFTFDASEVIPSVPENWGSEYKTFHCWVDEKGNHYGLGDDFCNLVEYDTDGIPIPVGDKLKGQTLTAKWVDHGVIAITVTVDGKPEAGHEEDFKLKDKSDTSIPPYTPLFTYQNGIYTYVSPSDENDPDYVPTGEYDLVFNPGTAQYVPVTIPINYQLDSTTSAVFDYHTISIEADPALYEDICDVNIVGNGFIAPGENNTVFVPDNAKLDIGTYMNADYGYHFDGYSVLGIKPGNKDNTATMDMTKPEQTITARGAAAIMAHAEPNVYHVEFNANAPAAGVTGEMADQDMVYGTAQNLFANQYRRAGATFIGWNTEKDGSGDPYRDGQSVQDLTKKDDGTVKLFAQWDLTTYNISYDLDGGHFPEGVRVLDKYNVGTATFTLAEPVWEDDTQEFLGWYGTDLSDPEKVVTIKEGSTGDREYTAWWGPKQYYVRYNSNGGSYVEPELVQIHEAAAKPVNPTRQGYTFQGWYADKKLTKKYDFKQEVTQDITLYAKWKAVPISGTPLVTLKEKGKHSLTVSWLKVKGADGYDIFAARCNHGGKKIACKKVKTIKAGQKLKWNMAGLKKGKAYKVYVKAYTVKNGKKTYVRTSPIAHAFAGGYSKHDTNAKAVKVKKNTVSLKKGKTFKIKASVKKLKKNRRLISKNHAPKLRYLSSNTKVATVSKAGKITAKAKGSCKIYVYAVNGVYKTVRVTVK